MKDAMSRGNMIGRAVDLFTFLRDRGPRPFPSAAVQPILGLGPRATYRWIQALEARGFVERAKPARRGIAVLWRSIVR